VLDPSISSCSIEYPKTETLFDRDPQTHRVIVGAIRCPEFELVKRWLVTEKIDGTNIRISLEMASSSDMWRVCFYGRTSAAQIPTFLLDYLQQTFTLEKMLRLCRGRENCEKCHGAGWSGLGIRGLVRCDCVPIYPLTLYGEGYGPKIQKGGGNYRDDPSFRLFDVRVGNKWLDWDAVKGIAGRLEIKPVPAFYTEDFENAAKITGLTFLDMVVELVRPPGFNSSVAQTDRPELNWNTTWIPAEGIVARTDPYLYDWRGRPLKFKLKTKDFPE